MNTKPFWQSKTFWLNIIAFLLAFIPQLRELLGTIPGTETASAVLFQAMNVLTIIARIWGSNLTLSSGGNS